MSINRKFYCLHLKHEYRGVAQLVERVVWDHQAAGSSPVLRPHENNPIILLLGSVRLFVYSSIPTLIVGKASTGLTLGEEKQLFSVFKIRNYLLESFFVSTEDQICYHLMLSI